MAFLRNWIVFFTMKIEAESFWKNWIIPICQSELELETFFGQKLSHFYMHNCALNA